MAGDAQGHGIEARGMAVIQRPKGAAVAGGATLEKYVRSCLEEIVCQAGSPDGLMGDGH